MEKAVVAGIDGSEPSLRALDWAVDEATVRGVGLRLVHASVWRRYEGDALSEGDGWAADRGLLEAASRRAHRRQPDVKITTEVIPDEPGSALVRAGLDACVLVLGNRGRTGFTELLLGSVSLAVAGLASCPLVVVRGSHDNRARPGTHHRIALGVGGPEAVDFALREAATRGAELLAVRAWRAPARESTDHPMFSAEPALLHEQRAVETLETALAKAPEQVRVRRKTAEGDTRQALVTASRQADLLVVGARRPAGHLGPRLGRVTHAMLHHAACPVAVVPEH